MFTVFLYQIFSFLRKTSISGDKMSNLNTIENKTK